MIQNHIKASMILQDSCITQQINIKNKKNKYPKENNKHTKNIK